MFALPARAVGAFRCSAEAPISGVQLHLEGALLYLILDNIISALTHIAPINSGGLERGGKIAGRKAED